MWQQKKLWNLAFFPELWAMLALLLSKELGEQKAKMLPKKKK